HLEGRGQRPLGSVDRDPDRLRVPARGRRLAGRVEDDHARVVEKVAELVVGPQALGGDEVERRPLGGRFAGQLDGVQGQLVENAAQAALVDPRADVYGK